MTDMTEDEIMKEIFIHLSESQELLRQLRVEKDQKGIDTSSISKKRALLLNFMTQIMEIRNGTAKTPW